MRKEHCLDAIAGNSARSDRRDEIADLNNCRRGVCWLAFAVWFLAAADSGVAERVESARAVPTRCAASARVVRTQGHHLHR